MHRKFEDFFGRGNWTKVLFWAGKVASDVELRGFLFFGLVIKKAGRRLSLRTPYFPLVLKILLVGRLITVTFQIKK